MFATTFVKSSNGYDLKVDHNVGKATETWLKNQECTFEAHTFEKYTLFQITSAPQAVVYRLSSKFLSATNDNNEIMGKADLLRQALEQQNWRTIQETTREWSGDVKKLVWLKLDENERLAIHNLAKMHKLYEVLEALKLPELKKVITILKEVGIISKSVKVTKDQKQKDLVIIVKELLPTHEKFLKAGLTLVLGDSE